MHFSANPVLMAFGGLIKLPMVENHFTKELFLDNKTLNFFLPQRDLSGLLRDEGTFDTHDPLQVWALYSLTVWFLNTI